MTRAGALALLVTIAFDPVVRAGTPQSPSETRRLGIDDRLMVAQVQDVQISPDGRWVAFHQRRTLLAENAYDHDLWVIEVNGSNPEPRRVTTTAPRRSGTAFFMPRWAPDSRRLGFFAPTAVVRGSGSRGAENGHYANRETALMFPIVLEVLRGIAHVHYAARRFDDAIEWSQKLLDLDPNYAAVAVVLQWAYEAQGLYDKALDARLKGSLAAGDTPERIAAARRVYAQGGWRGYWRYVLKEGYRPDFVPRRSYQFAEIHVKVGEHEEAFRLLQQAYEERSGYLHQLLTHAIWDDLRPDPRFDELLERMNLRQR